MCFVLIFDARGRELRLQLYGWKRSEVGTLFPSVSHDASKFGVLQLCSELSGNS